MLLFVTYRRQIWRPRGVESTHQEPSEWHKAQNLPMLMTTSTNGTTLELAKT